MARRKKAEVKSSVKQQTKSSVVRKSSRQSAKKQVEEQKVNGDDACSIISEDVKDFSDDNNHELNKKLPKKLIKQKNLVDKGKSIIENENIHSVSSDNQDDIETVSSSIEKLQSTDIKHDNSNENTLSEIAWPEDIIEETIICEEMEVETELNDDGSAVQDESVIVEEVLFVNDPNFEDKDILEYTVIQNEDVSQPMIVSSNTSETVNENVTNSASCLNVEQDLRDLKVLDSKIVDVSKTVESVAISKNDETSETLSDNFVNNCSVHDNSSIKKESRSLRSVTRSSKNTRTKNNEKNSDEKKRREKFSKKGCESESKVNTFDSKDKSIKSKKSNSLIDENLSESGNIQFSLEQLKHSMSVSQEYSPMSVQVEHSEVANASSTDCVKSRKISSNGFVLQHKNTCSQVETKVDIPTSSTVKPKHGLIVNEEQSRDSEIDGKIDSEDAKVSSSSENSSDTLLSSNSCKVLEFNAEKKNIVTSSATNEIEKKTGFRSRSGSTDTTGSESGSNSSGVRRSNRIRTIGLMKQRSRGRGVVTKPLADSTRTTIQQDQDKLLINTLTQDVDTNQNKDNLEKPFEMQLDKENGSKSSSCQDTVSQSTGSTGYESDTNKPVKVKSRWRRSSELEMSNSGSWLTPRSNLGLASNNTLPGTVGMVSTSLGDTAIANKIINSNSSTTQELKLINFDSAVVKNQINQDVNVVRDSSIKTEINITNTTSAVIPKAVGAKISLPMVPEMADREMEERLSQFEHLKENLYLTERYTSKETKRMVCDCFLTEEEIQRDELGCGEDCLNRLLMIECGSRCIVGDRCTNKRFQNCEYAKCEVFRTEKKGFGLRATSDLKAGEFIMEYVGEVVDARDFRRRAKEYSKDKNRHYYFMALKSDQIIDATMKGNISRFINHSCDPNAETQKWTVNGELRIGFFNRKFVAAGEEITFDYHFQRYGEEAQKCFCEAINCRGWIGDNPNDNKEKVKYIEDLEDDSEDDDDDDVEDKEDKENKEEKPNKQIRRKREEKKVADHMEDEDLEEQIDLLCSSGLKNRSHTLTLSRLMVRCREIQHRTRLLKVIQSGEQPCRRLFLDYHGLRLMWSYMMDVAGSTSEEAQQFRLEILKTLSTLPIPNRTMLIDSKVLNVIEKWSKQMYHSSSGDSPEDDQSKLKSSNDETEMDLSDVANSLNNVIGVSDRKKEGASEVKNEESRTENLEQTLISELASNLLADWSNLKEVFRIPKKERLEQMKEHEREADRGYKEDAEKEAKESMTNDRVRSDGYNRNLTDKRGDRRRGRDSPEFEQNRSKEKRGLEDRPNLVQVPRMSKFERRQLFAMKVAKEEEERQRRQQEESWQQHEAQCLALGLDPYTTAAIDSQSGYPLFFNPQLAQWQAYPIQDQGQASELSQQCTSVYVPPGGLPVMPAMSTMPIPPGAPPAPMYALGQLPSNYAHSQLVQIHNGATPPMYTEKAPESLALEAEHEASSDSKALAVPAPIPPTAPPPSLDLPPKWRWARDKRGRLYYYHVKERVSQWLPPPPEHIAAHADSSTTSESSDESSSSNDEEDEELEEEPDEDDENDVNEQSEEQAERQLAEGMELDSVDSEVLSGCQVSGQINSQPEVKKRRDGLVQERIISPRREEDRVDHKKYKEIKEKLKRQKERAKLKEHLEKMRKHRRSSKSKSHVKHSTTKFQPITSDMSPTTERKIKDTFRINMANVMVHFLNPYRKNDCKQGRITNTEDFKHLARKLTHFVLAKELKHCKSVDELECNDNVKHKAKDFVRKYMSKFGAVYQKGTDED